MTFIMLGRHFFSNFTRLRIQMSFFGGEKCCLTELDEKIDITLMSS